MYRSTVLGKNQVCRGAYRETSRQTDSQHSFFNKWDRGVGGGWEAWDGRGHENGSVCVLTQIILIIVTTEVRWKQMLILVENVSIETDHWQLYFYSQKLQANVKHRKADTKTNVQISLKPFHVHSNSLSFIFPSCLKICTLLSTTSS